MNLAEIERYWLESSDDDFQVVAVLIAKRKFTHAMFFLHLSIEKLLKALFVNRNKREAPLSHDLQYLARKVTGITFDREQLQLLAKITTFNIATRYDDYKRNFHQLCNATFARYYYHESEELRKWLRYQIR